jgi:CheY-like chemotaxis protein
MDIQLPGIDGYEATRRIKTDAMLCGIPIIAVTSHALRETPRKPVPRVAMLIGDQPDNGKRARHRDPRRHCSRPPKIGGLRLGEVPRDHG